jgi:hypothetical protein
VSSITIVSDAPNFGITYDRHYDDSNSFIIQATGNLTAMAPMINSLNVSDKLVTFRTPALFITITKRANLQRV